MKSFCYGFPCSQCFTFVEHLLKRHASEAGRKGEESCLLELCLEAFSDSPNALP